MDVQGGGILATLWRRPQPPHFFPLFHCSFCGSSAAFTQAAAPGSRRLPLASRPCPCLGSSQQLAERGCRDEPTLCSDLVLLRLVEAGVHAARVGSSTGLASLVKHDKTW